MKISTTDFEYFARWIEYMKYNPDTLMWKAVIYPGKIIEAKNFDRLFFLITNTIATDLKMLVFDFLELDYKKHNDGRRYREYADARHVCVFILRNYYRFTYDMIKHSLSFTSNRTIKNAIDNMAVPEVNRKLKKVLDAYPWITDSEQLFKF